MTARNRRHRRTVVAFVLLGWFVVWIIGAVGQPGGGSVPLDLAAAGGVGSVGGKQAVDEIEPLAPVRAVPAMDSAPLVGPAAIKVRSRSCQGLTSGTGVLVDSGGLVALVTNQHVIAGATEIVVDSELLGSGGEVEIVVVAADVARDLAIGLPVTDAGGEDFGRGAAESWPKTLPVLNLAAASPERGAPLWVAGYPGGRALTVVDANVQTSVPGPAYGFDGQVLLVRGAAVPGMSGGPIVGADGDLVAVVAAVDQTTDLVVGVEAGEIRSLMSDVAAGVQADHTPAAPIHC